MLTVTVLAGVAGTFANPHEDGLLSRNRHETSDLAIADSLILVRSFASPHLASPTAEVQRYGP